MEKLGTRKEDLILELQKAYHQKTEMLQHNIKTASPVEGIQAELAELKTKIDELTQSE